MQAKMWLRGLVFVNYEVVTYNNFEFLAGIRAKTLLFYLFLLVITQISAWKR